VALHGFDDDVRRGLTAAVYGSMGGYREEGLFDWEKSWFEEDLPTAPARVLVGGAGTGRELRHLAAAGYEQVAFDPVQGFVERARRIADGSSCLAVLQGAYEDLADPAGAGAARFAAEVERFSPYDAVLLGWGSLTHVTTARHREGLLAALRRLCPAGPVLASFWMRAEGEAAAEGRAARLGRRLGRIIGGRDDAPLDGGDRFLSHCGFAHSFTEAEIRDLARHAGYTVRRLGAGPHTYPHVTPGAG
jgi:SAM-dependent methyltransferase